MSSQENRRQGGAQALRMLIPTLAQMIHTRFWWLHREEIEDVVMAAIERLLEQNKDCLRNPEKELEEGIVRSLYVWGCRFASNGRRADRRRKQREEEYARRKKIENITKNSVTKAASAEVLVMGGGGMTQQAALECLLVHLTTRERNFVELVRQGVEDIHPYAELLGVTESSPEEQEQAVQREWHRLEMKLRRMKTRFEVWSVAKVERY